MFNLFNHGCFIALKFKRWGLRHNIGQYIPLPIPLDLAAGFYSQSFKVGDIVDANAWLINLQASYSLLLFTFYGGLGYESSTLDIEYTYSDPNSSTEIEERFDLKGQNSVRFTAGVTLNLGPIRLNTDYSLASQSVLTVGLGVGIGDK